jgi:pantoate--beta-alanine ligase
VEVITTRAAWRAACEQVRGSGSSLGFVPTMGALHEGHASLVRAAAADCDVVGVSIFVNPLQFGDPADLERYPRTLEADVELAAAAGATLVFAPEVEEIYPDFPRMPETRVHVAGPSVGFEGSDRPGHFDGVATVVALLFSLTGRCRAYFGEKDYQQLCVVSTMAADLGLDVEVVGCPTVREPDGLAMSSRNVRLSPEGRRAATALFRALESGRSALSGGRSGTDAEAAMAASIEAEPRARLFYAACVDPSTLAPLDTLAAGARARLLVAAEVDGVRLIDNVPAVAGPTT